LQFLIDSNGHIFIADPLKISTGGSGMSANNKKMINGLIAAAEENLKRDK